MIRSKAGGFDAVWLLVCEPPMDTPGIPPLPRIERLWSGFPGVAPLLAQESKAQGVALEKLDDVPGLAAAVAAAAHDYYGDEARKDGITDVVLS